MKKYLKLFIIICLASALVCMPKVSAANKAKPMIVIAGGEAFGIKLFSEGVIVTKTESFICEGKSVCPAEYAGIKVNDIIIGADNISINTNKDFKNIIENSEGKSIEIKLRRNDKEIITNLIPLKNENDKYKAGMWIKDSAAGLGTITFYSEELNSFCGLGHGICETDTGKLIPLSFGDVEYANVTSVTMSKNGNVGTLNGYFTDNDIGTAKLNNENGIYGTLKNPVNKTEYIEIADSDETEKGSAYILTTLSGETPKKYDVKIKKIKKHNDQYNLVFEITDEELICICGGIVQGMSGSPIIQNGKIVGAVTHVFVDDVTTGYGIFAEKMYDEMLNVSQNVE